MYLCRANTFVTNYSHNHIMKRKELKRLVMFTAIVTSAIATPFIAKATLTAKAATVLNQQTDEQTPVYVWVSPQGSDTASGTEDSPFATLHVRTVLNHIQIMLPGNRQQFL